MADYVVKLSGQDKLSPTINQVKKSLEGMSSTAKGADKIRETFDKIQNSSAPLRKKLSDTKKEMEKLAAMGDTSSNQFKKMAAAAKQYQTTLDKVNSSIKNVNASSKGLSFGGDMKGMLSGLQSQMGSLGGMASKLGPMLANPYVLAGAAIGGATVAFVNYNKELERSLQKTAQFTGLAGDELMSLRNGIKSVADTFDKDYDTVLSAVDGLMAQFGITGEQALNVIRDGFVAGADDGGRMLDMISQYAGAFHDAGISADEMVAIISNTRSGIFSEEGMELFSKGAMKVREFSNGLADSLENVGINATEMYDKLQSGQMTTVQAIQQISKHLKDLDPQSQAVGEVMKNVFGKQASAAGYELVTALADVETNLGVCMEKTGEWGESMLKLQEADRELENALASLFGVSEGGFANMTTMLKAEVFGAIAKVINKFIELYNESLVLRGYIQNLGLQFKVTWDLIKVILKLFMNAMKQLGAVIEGVLTLDFKKVVSAWKNGVENILTIVADGFSEIANDVADSVDNTFNGKIKKIEVQADVTYGESKKSGGSGSAAPKKKVERGSTKSKTTKVEPDKTQLELDREAFDKITKNARQAIADFNAGLISKEQLQQSIDEANQFYKSHDMKAVIDVEYNVDDRGFEVAAEKKVNVKMELDKAAFDKITKNARQAIADFNAGLISKEQLQQSIDEANQFYKSHDLKAVIDVEYNVDDRGFEVADEKVNVKMELDKTQLELDRAAFDKITKQAKQAIQDFNLGLITKEQLQQSVDEVNQFYKSHDMKAIIELEYATTDQGFEVAAEKKDNVTTPQAKEGSIKYIQDQIKGKQEQLELEVVGTDEYNALAREIAALEDEEHKIQVAIDNDGIMNSMEMLEKSKEKFEATMAAVDGIGNAFSAVGGAIEGSAGQILNFAGQSIQAIGQVIPQIVALIGAKQAEAMASGTASAAAMPFPANIAAIASIIATIAGIFASIPAFAEGGIVGGGSISGDKLLARVNSGEMILNGSQQDNLFRAITEDRLGGGPAMAGQVEFKIEGTHLKGVMRNTDNKMKKQR